MSNHYNQTDNKMAKNSIRRAYQELKKIFKLIFSMEDDVHNRKLHKDRKTKSSLTQEDRRYVGIYVDNSDNSYKRYEE